MNLTTDRLIIKPLTVSDGDFIQELVNTEGWLKFIGNRNVNSPADAGAYIQKILDNKNVSYWVVQLKDSMNKIGIVTYIKRDYLDHHDIGFAFLPGFAGKGYAYEATHAVLTKLVAKDKLTHILATTVPENVSSIKLLEKLGLAFEREIELEKEKIHVYGAATGKLASAL